MSDVAISSLLTAYNSNRAAAKVFSRLLKCVGPCIRGTECPDKKDNLLTGFAAVCNAFVGFHISLLGRFVAVDLIEKAKC